MILDKNIAQMTEGRIKVKYIKNWKIAPLSLNKQLHKSHFQINLNLQIFIHYKIYLCLDLIDHVFSQEEGVFIFYFFSTIQHFYLPDTWKEFLIDLFFSSQNNSVCCPLKCIARATSPRPSLVPQLQKSHPTPLLWAAMTSIFYKCIYLSLWLFLKFNKVKFFDKLILLRS